MLRSMTGFGRATAEKEGRELVIEMKSVNHRFLDLNIRMPRALAFAEEEIRSQLGSCMARGHVDVYVHYANHRNDARQVLLDEAIFATYRDVAQRAADLSGLDNNMELAAYLAMADVLRIEEAEEDRAAVLALVQQALPQACRELLAMRQREGERLAADLAMRMGQIRQLAAQIGQRAPLVVQEHQGKLRARIEQLLGGSVPLDEGRLENEVAYMADRADIAEELVRLDSHFDAFDTLLAASQPAGRKMDFLVQEINRECNTIGSKANDAEIVAAVIAAKAELERVREQVQNIE